MSIRNRVKGLRTVKASDLVPNEKNWRLHPEQQRSTLSELLKEIGMVGAVIARELPDGRLELVDGHLRAVLAKDAEVPVLVVDLNDDEAAKVLATYDPIGDLARCDDDSLRELLGTIEFDENAELRHMLVKLSDKLAAEEDGEESEEVKNDIPGMALQPHEHYDYLVVLATTTHEWNVLCDKLGLKPEKRRNRIGTCRAIRARQMLQALGVDIEAAPQKDSKPEKGGRKKAS